MEHHFDTELAQKYGIFEAVLINHFRFWLAKNAANKVHFHDGRYWTFNSIDAFQKLFPYVSYKTMRNALEKLRKQGVLLTGKFNSDTHNQTLWYSLSDEIEVQGKCICPKGQIELPKTANVTDNNVPSKEGTTQQDNTPIIIEEESTSHIPPIVPQKEKRFRKPTLEEVKAYCEERRNSVDPQHFIDYYESNGWRVGRNPMKDWKAAVRTWERKENKPLNSSSYGDTRPSAGPKDTGGHREHNYNFSFG